MLLRSAKNMTSNKNKTPSQLTDIELYRDSISDKPESMKPDLGVGLAIEGFSPRSAFVFNYRYSKYLKETIATKSIHIKQLRFHSEHVAKQIYPEVSNMSQCIRMLRRSYKVNLLEYSPYQYQEELITYTCAIEEELIKIHEQKKTLKLSSISESIKMLSYSVWAIAIILGALMVKIYQLLAQ